MLRESNASGDVNKMQIIQVHPKSVSSNAGNRSPRAATIRKPQRCWSANEYCSWGENTSLFPPVKLFQFLEAECCALKDVTPVQGQAQEMNPRKSHASVTSACQWSLSKHPLLPSTSLGSSPGWAELSFQCKLYCLQPGPCVLSLPFWLPPIKEASKGGNLPFISLQLSLWKSTSLLSFLSFEGQFITLGIFNFKLKYDLIKNPVQP